MAKKSHEPSTGRDSFKGFGGFLGGLGGLIEKIAEMAEKAEKIEQEGGEASKYKIVSGFTIRTGLRPDNCNGNGSDIKIEPFGNVHKDQQTGQTVIHEAREPMVDVFDEPDHVLVVAELPGVSSEDIHLELEDDLLTIEAARGDKKYRKEVQLPDKMDMANMSQTCHHGMLEIRFVKK